MEEENLINIITILLTFAGLGLILGFVCGFALVIGIF